MILTDLLQQRLNAGITKVIVGHSHSDCMGGLSALHEMGIESIACNKTIQICKSQKLPIPQQSFSDSFVFEFEGEKVICRYFGAGHTADNIVVYFPDSQLLFGGCLIKSLDSKGLGNTREADIGAWDTTVLTIRNVYPRIRLVIPGHGALGDHNLLDHTINLVKAHQSMAK